MKRPVPKPCSSAILTGRQVSRRGYFFLRRFATFAAGAADPIAKSSSLWPSFNSATNQRGRCRQLLEARDAAAASEPIANRAKGNRPFTTADFALCPDCGGFMRRIAVVPRSRTAPPFRCDTS